MRVLGTPTCALLLVALFCPPRATARGQARANAQLSATVKIFVRRFYSWYVPEALKANEAPAWNVALKFRGEVFSVTLFRALKEDSDAQARVSGQVAGLDFDPFLNTQDPCDRYRVGTVAPHGAGFRVAIYGMCSGRRNERPVVIAEVERQRGSWVFADFLYPTIRTDLLRTLKALQAERQKAKHSR